MSKENKLLIDMIRELDKTANVSNDEKELFSLWRGLINQKEDINISNDYLLLEDEFLNIYHQKQEKLELKDLSKSKCKNIYTYHGDITKLKVDAIVNAANSKMLGCMKPNHLCIDNTIHTLSGYRLRLDILKNIKRPLPIGFAKITKAYNLPCKYILHTVGPIVSSCMPMSNVKKDLLKRAYLSCLKLAKENGIKTVAFCCISTGVYGFDKEIAANIAVKTVKEFLENEKDMNIIFNTFTNEDKLIYDKLLNEESSAEKLAKIIKEADAVVVGIGAGMSAADGFTYIGSRFENAFPDFITKYGLLDMLQASLYNFESVEEYWAFQSRFIALNYLDQGIGKSYVNLLEILKDKNYHIITTNADNAFWAANYNPKKVFHIQGEYALFQCSKHCHQQTYRDDKLIREMIEKQKDMLVPTELVPKCPKCNEPLEVNKRNEEKGMVEDSDFHAQKKRYEEFLEKNKKGKVVYLEIGVGNTTPQFIKHPFWKFVSENDEAIYVSLNHKHYRIPSIIRNKSIEFSEDIAKLLDETKKYIKE
ncbi:MAG: protein-ADP-ribose hydrolase [Oceanivirga sp.]|nr:protein-ADP-ribose hydrolase [Oceanivirga sp.]